MAKNRTRRNRNKTEGGKRRNRNKTEGGSCGGMKLAGGKRKTRKLSKGASEWNKAVMRVYGEMKKKNGSVSFGDALKEASKRKKAGTL
jgi:hypothetical protein